MNSPSSSAARPKRSTREGKVVATSNRRPPLAAVAAVSSISPARSSRSRRPIRRSRSKAGAHMTVRGRARRSSLRRGRSRSVRSLAPRIGRGRRSSACSDLRHQPPAAPIPRPGRAARAGGQRHAPRKRLQGHLYPQPGARHRACAGHGRSRHVPAPHEGRSVHRKSGDFAGQAERNRQRRAP